MARKPREKSPIGLYYVTLRGMDADGIFSDEADYAKFVALLHSLTAAGDDGEPSLALHAYCLLPRRVHLLLCERGEPLGRGMGRLAGGYTLYYNKRHGHAGPLYQDRFRSEPVNDADYFVALLRHIHKLPIEAGLADSLLDYPWSSWLEYAKPEKGTCHLCTHEMPFDDVDWESMCRLMRLLPSYDAQRLVADVRRHERGGLIAAVEAELPAGVALDQVNGLRRDVRAQFVTRALDCGVGLRQLARLTGMEYSTVARINRRNRKPAPAK